jgi:hypothetical protein
MTAVPLPKSGPVCYADAQSILEYRLPMVGSHLPGVRDVGLWTTDQMRAYAQATADAWAKKLDAALQAAIEAARQDWGRPVAWDHILRGEGQNLDRGLTYRATSPFGKPGIGHSASYSIISTPLYAKKAMK